MVVAGPQVAEGCGVLLITGTFVLLMWLHSRCSARTRGVPEAWHRQELPGESRRAFGGLMARVISDPHCHWEAFDRQLETIQARTGERLGAKIEAGNARARTSRRPSSIMASQPELR